MAEYSRRGHYRTNANGTTFWVRGHHVVREEYTLSRRGDDFFINGTKVIPNVTCKHCYKQVFFYQNEHGSRVYFDRLGDPWPKHDCYHGAPQKEGERQGAGSSPKPMGPQYDPEVLERRHAEILRKSEGNKQRHKRAKRQRRKQLKQELKELQKKLAQKKAREVNEAEQAKKKEIAASERAARTRWKRWRDSAAVVVEVRKKRVVDRD